MNPQTATTGVRSGIEERVGKVEEVLNMIQSIAEERGTKTAEALVCRAVKKVFSLQKKSLKTKYSPLKEI